MENIKGYLLKSLLSLENPLFKTEDILEWINERNDTIAVNVNKIKFSELKNWEFTSDKYKLKHNSDKFFSIQGLDVKVQYENENIKGWEQPIINQPEVGYLGFITKEIGGVLYFLIQAKIEPGNVNYVQLSPTVQATKSNYTKVHGGKIPNYLEYFLNVKPEHIILDQLQSEQGARFFRKRNRNIIIKVDQEIELEEDFRWLTLGQIKHLMSYDNVVNMDTRTVISGLLYGDYSIETYDFFNIIKRTQSTKGNDFLKSLLVSNISKFNTSQIIHWLTDIKSKYESCVLYKSLNNLYNWQIDEHSINHISNDLFEVIGVNVEISNREVVSWDQPLVKPMHKGICGFVVKEIKGIIHFLVQAKYEPGLMDIVELAPTVQCSNEKSVEVPYLELFLNATEENIIFDTYQSEEGGRFYREQNKNIIIKVNDEFSEEIPEDYNWLTLNQLKKFIQFNNFVNIQARSLISAVNFI